MCMPCPVGSYQNELGQLQCKSCPIILTKSGTTSSIGARSVNECKPRCSAGKFYDESLGLCRSCGHGNYQPNEGSFACFSCGSDLTTRSAEAVSKEECKPQCKAGYQLSEIGQCEPCAVGTYRTSSMSSCEQCPSENTTANHASTSIKDCK